MSWNYILKRGEKSEKCKLRKNRYNGIPFLQNTVSHTCMSCIFRYLNIYMCVYMEL